MEISYATHTAWSNPGSFRNRLDELPSTPRDLADVFENFMIHNDVARLLSEANARYADSDRALRTVERLLGAAFARDRRTLLARRDIPAYLNVTSRDFALIATSVLRSNGVEARVRVGFADYFRVDHWEEHWLCEYRLGDQWRLLDAQLGWLARQALGIDFAVHDVPRERFLTASQLWLAIRSGNIKAANCGRYHHRTRGAWLPAVNLFKDVAALCGVEALPSDYWGPAVEFSRNRAVSVKAYEELDTLAGAFDDAPQSPWEARARVARYPWANPFESRVANEDRAAGRGWAMKLPALRRVSVPQIGSVTAGN